jgi:hypothetical protein
VFCFLVVEPQDIGFLPQSGSVLGSEVRRLLSVLVGSSAALYRTWVAALLNQSPSLHCSHCSTCCLPGLLGARVLLQEGSEPLTPRSEASDVSGMSAEARAYLERHLANIARGRGGLVPAHVQAHLGEPSCPPVC